MSNHKAFRWRRDKNIVWCSDTEESKSQPDDIINKLHILTYESNQKKYIMNLLLFLSKFAFNIMILVQTDHSHLYRNADLPNFPAYRYNVTYDI